MKLVVIEPGWNPWLAWLKSLPLAILIPLPLWAAFIAVGSFREAYELAAITAQIYLVGFFSLIVHVIAYAMVGLPVFLLGRYQTFGWIWYRPTSWALDAGLGVIPTLIIATLIYGTGMYKSTEILIWVGILAGYGVISGFAARTQRPGRRSPAPSPKPRPASAACL